MSNLTVISCKKNRWILFAVWLFAIAISLLWNIKSFDRERENNALQTARSFFHFIVAATTWDTGPDGGNDPKISSTDTTSHPTQIDTDKYIELPHSSRAVMTRRISAMTALENHVSFRIINLKHDSTQNKADKWEKKALQAFAKGFSEYSAYINGGTERRYHYMAPIFTAEQCIKCDEKQGYELTDIHDVISITLPPEKRPINWPLFVSHGLAAAAGIILFRFFASQLWKAEEKMELFASRDSLTGVANRRFFQEYLQREWLRAKRNKTSLSLIMCDIDSFRQYNKTYGHRAGDNCLAQVADAITSALNRPADFIARYSGVKFALILPETASSGAETLGKIILKLVENLRIEHLHSAASKYVTVSIGITDNITLSTPNEIIADADKALLQAKKEGRNRIICLPHSEEQNPS